MNIKFISPYKFAHSARESMLEKTLLIYRFTEASIVNKHFLNLSQRSNGCSYLKSYPNALCVYLQLFSLSQPQQARRVVPRMILKGKLSN